MKCSKVDTCLYCDCVLSSRHEHDHFPIPAETGGETMFCVCINCHDIKDRIPIDGRLAGPYLNALLEDWPHLSPLTRVFMAKMMRQFCVWAAKMEDQGVRIPEHLSRSGAL